MQTAHDEGQLWVGLCQAQQAAKRNIDNGKRWQNDPSNNVPLYKTLLEHKTTSTYLFQESTRNLVQSVSSRRHRGGSIRGGNHEERRRACIKKDASLECMMEKVSESKHQGEGIRVEESLKRHRGEGGITWLSLSLGN